MEISCVVNGADSAKQNMNAEPELKPIFYSHSTISSCHHCWRIRKLKSSSPVSTNWSLGQVTSRSMHSNRQSAVKNGLAGSWSRVAPTADIPAKTLCRKLSKLLVLTLTKRSYLVSQPCRSCSVSLASKSSLQPISVGHFLRTVQYMPSVSAPCSCVCSRLTSPSASSWRKRDNTLICQSQGRIQRRTLYSI